MTNPVNGLVHRGAVFKLFQVIQADNQAAVTAVNLHAKDAIVFRGLVEGWFAPCRGVANGSVGEQEA